VIGPSTVDPQIRPSDTLLLKTKSSQQESTASILRSIVRHDAMYVNGGQEARLNGGGHSLYWIETHFLPAWESRREA
jgi:hypothetical protein